MQVTDVPHAKEYVEELVKYLDTRRGVLLTSSYEFPGRYARWTIGFSDPPLELSGVGREFKVRALNDRQGASGGFRGGRDRGAVEKVQQSKAERVQVVAAGHHKSK